MSKYWLDYVKYCYDLVLESEGANSIILDHEAEAYVVHLMANNFQRTDIGEKAVAIQMLTAMGTQKKKDFIAVADECLLIHSYPLKQNKWPSPTYYQEMGTTAYGMAAHLMEDHFDSAAKVLNFIFSRSLKKLQ